MIEYDEELDRLLVSKNVTYLNVRSSFKIVRATSVGFIDDREEAAQNYIEELLDSTYGLKPSISAETNGTIFMLPGPQGSINMYFTYLIKSDIIRMLRLSVFM